MSKLTEKIEQYTEASKKLGLGLSEDLIQRVTKGLGPSIYNKDAESVSCSSKDELARVRDNFLKKKLGLNDSDETLDNRNKYRALFYALLAKKFGKESVYA